MEKNELQMVNTEIKIGDNKTIPCQVNFALITSGYSSNMLDIYCDLETKFKYQQLRNKLLTHQEMFFSWLNSSCSNSESFFNDPLNNLKQAGLDLSPEDFALLEVVGKSYLEKADQQNRSENSINTFKSLGFVEEVKTETEQTDTQGWDIIAAITEKSINENFAFAYDQHLLPEAVSAQYDFGGSYSLECVFGPPVVDLAGVTTDILNLEISITSGFISGPDSKVDLSGATLTMSTAVNQVELTIDGKQELRLFIDLLNDQAIYSIKVDGLDDDFLEFMLNYLISLVLAEMKTGTYYLGSVDISDLDIPDYLIPTNVSFAMVPGENQEPDKNAFLMLIQTTGNGGTKYFDNTTIPDSESSSVLLSNERLLIDVFGKQLESAIEGATFNYNDQKLSLNNETDYEGYTLRNITVEIVEGKVRVVFDIKATEPGINVYVTTISDTSFELSEDDNGNQIIGFHTVTDSQSSFTLDLWVWVAIALSGGTAALVLGPIIAAVVVAVYFIIDSAVSGNDASDIISDELSSVLVPIVWPYDETYLLTGVDAPSSLRVTGELTI